jgi:type II secretory pathway pseudopilin PulG
MRVNDLQFPSRFSLRLLVTLAQSNKLKRRKLQFDSGLTLIECLVAIIIVTLTVVAITQPIMVATGTRIQIRKQDQANQIAQGEVDRIRVIMERASTEADTIDVKALPDPFTGENLKDAAAATGTPTDPPSATSPLQSSSACTDKGVTNTSRYPFPAIPATVFAKENLVQVDINGDCIPEYVMQVFRSEGVKISATDTVPSTFDVGVRVYAHYPGQPFPTAALEKTKASLVMGTGPRDSVGGDRRRPLAVLYSSVSRSNTSDVLCPVRQAASKRLGTAANDPCVAPSASPSPSPSATTTP